MIGTTTSSEYRKYIEGTSLSRDVFTNQIAEHAILITQEILQDLREIYEKHH
jgi:ATP-dependent Clp protease ATP-binding subunit ClpA|tara:strand:- start:2021 stop:2176 length:156 start_codon:yes stop_codon:yes gene_type:complete